MNIPGLSTGGLLMLQGSIKQAFAVDDATPSGEDKPYGVRSYSDWRAMADEIESELQKRKLNFEPVRW